MLYTGEKTWNWGHYPGAKFVCWRANQVAWYYKNKYAITDSNPSIYSDVVNWKFCKNRKKLYKGNRNWKEI